MKGSAKVMKSTARRPLGRRSMGVALWLASLVLGLALITGVVGGTGARAAHDSGVQHVTSVDIAPRAAFPGAHRRLLQQRIGGTPASSQ